MTYAPARRSAFWIAILRAAIFGALSGIFAIVFLSLEHVLIGLVWGHDLPTDWLSGGWRALVVPVVAGVIVGVLYLAVTTGEVVPGGMV